VGATLGSTVGEGVAGATVSGGGDAVGDSLGIATLGVEHATSATASSRETQALNLDPM
jgi:hypothetical protein